MILEGTYVTKNDEIQFSIDGGEVAGEESPKKGTYHWSFSDKKLTLTPQDDVEPGHSKLLGQSWKVFADPLTIIGRWSEKADVLSERTLYEFCEDGSIRQSGANWSSLPTSFSKIPERMELIGKYEILANATILLTTKNTSPRKLGGGGDSKVILAEIQVSRDKLSYKEIIKYQELDGTLYVTPGDLAKAKTTELWRRPYALELSPLNLGSFFSLIPTAFQSE